MKSEDIVDLSYFPGGFHWRQHMDEELAGTCLKIASTSPSALESVIQILKGAFVNFPSYEGVKWSVLFKPLTYLHILIVFVQDEEFGNSLHMYYSRQARDEMPTEEVMVFSEAYLDLLGFEAEAERQTTFTEQVIEPDEALRRIQQLATLDVSKIEQIARSLNASSRRDGSTTRIEFEPMQNFKVMYGFKKDYIEISCMWPSDPDLQRIVSSFPYLYANAILRAATS